MQLNNHSEERIFVEKLANVFVPKKQVTVSQGDFNIAYCDVKKNKIWIDFPKVLQDIEPYEEFMRLKGLAFHEMLHLIFTTRTKRLRSHKYSGLFDLMQRLEDGRIETLGVLAYEKLADYLNYSINEYLVKELEKQELTFDELLFLYILVYGRKLLIENMKVVAEIRKQVLKAFGQEIVGYVEKSVDKYIIAKRSDERFDIAQDLYYFLTQKKFDLPDNNMSAKLDIDDTRNEGKTLPKEMRDLEQELKELEELNKDMRKSIQKDSDVSKTEQGKAMKAKAKKEKQIDAKIKKLEEKLAKNKSRIDSIYYKPSTKTAEGKLKKLRDLLNKIHDEMDRLEDEKKIKKVSGVGDEVGRMLDEIKKRNEELVEKNKIDLSNDLKAVGRMLDNVYSDSSFNPDKEMQDSAKSLEKALKLLQKGLVKGYVKGHRTGKVNMKRYLNRNNRADTKIFNKWTPDRLRKSKVLVNMYIDGSGSMSLPDWRTCLKACWIINEALNKDQNKVMIYQFSNDYMKMKDYDGILTIPTQFGGGTRPVHAINHSLPLIEKYKRKHYFQHVVDIIITDGQFSQDSKDCADRLNKLGHETILIYVKSCAQNSNFDFYEKEYRHKAKHFIVLDRFDRLADELVGIFTKIKRGIVHKEKVM